ncbi:MAG: NAD(P)H-dependent oxidoreductase [Verrucomicrobiota bacterium]
MKILIVHAHPEAKSFSSALAKTAAEKLTSAGHSVDLLDLYRAGFDPVSDRRNFTTQKDPDYYKQQVEESYAAEKDGFEPNLDREIARLEGADALIFSFPLWWFGMPAILKGWCDRVLVYKRIYGGDQFYDSGIGKNKKPGLILMTTGGGQDMYDGYGINPSMETILTPINHGVFWFNGFTPLDPFIAWSPAHVEDEGRSAILKNLEERIVGIFEESPQILPKIADFDGMVGTDNLKRYLVEVRLKDSPDESFEALVPAEIEALSQQKKQGRLLDFQRASHEDWKKVRVYLKYRARSEKETLDYLKELPLYDRLDCTVLELDRIHLD